MSDPRPTREQPGLFSIGHSNVPLEAFLELLARHKVEVLADVRSQPYSKYASQFNAEALERAAADAGLKYLYLGRELGGRPDGDEFYDDEGHVLYQRVAESAPFVQGIERLVHGVEKYRVAMMCSEENPLVCHRHLLLAPVLTVRGIRVHNIRGDGQVQTETELNAGEREKRDRGQQRLFDEPEEPAWRSLRSVLPRRRPPNSSDS
jgi:uncharacterized protein (DUF488 family)